mgnify:CR=1 FL=1
MFFGCLDLFYRLIKATFLLLLSFFPSLNNLVIYSRSNISCRPCYLRLLLAFVTYLRQQRIMALAYKENGKPWFKIPRLLVLPCS